MDLTSMQGKAELKSPVLRLLDFADEIVQGKEQARANLFVCFAYAIFGCFSMVVWRHFSDQDFSALVTFAGLTQMLAFFLLLHKVKVTKSAAGISSRTLQMYVLCFCFRLSSTMVKNGYLPVDRSADWVYQAADIASLLLALQLLLLIHGRYSQTYQGELDTFPIAKLFPFCVVLGVGLRGELNRSPVFDSCWAIGLWCDCVAMLPQLWLLAKRQQVSALTSNFVALTFLSRCMTWTFWYSGFAELAPQGGVNVTGSVIMVAQTLQLLLSADFMYLYFTWQSGQCGKTCGLRTLGWSDRAAPASALEEPDMEFDFEPRW